jgi:hypothetical protein
MRNVLRPYRRTDAPPVIATPPKATSRARSLASWVAHAYERLGLRSRARIVGRRRCTSSRATSSKAIRSASRRWSTSSRR